MKNKSRVYKDLSKQVGWIFEHYLWVSFDQNPGYDFVSQFFTDTKVKPSRFAYFTFFESISMDVLEEFDIEDCVF